MRPQHSIVTGASSTSLFDQSDDGEKHFYRKSFDLKRICFTVSPAIMLPTYEQNLIRNGV